MDSNTPDFIKQKEGSRKRALLETRKTTPSKAPENIIKDLTFCRRMVLKENRHVVVEKFRGKTYVKIRDYHQVKKKGFPLAPGRGINLTVQEWECLKTMTQAIDAAVQEVDDACIG